MPRPIVTKDLVFECANTLLAAGKEPTLILVKERIGGGSYSTIKPFLDLWNDQRKAQQIAIPDHIHQRAVEFVRTMWTAALTHDDGRIAQIRLDAQHQIDEITAKLSNAEQVIEHLEHDADERQRLVEEAQDTISALRAELAERQPAAALAEARGARQVAEARAATLAQQVADLRAELEEQRKQCEGMIAKQLEQIQRQVLELAQKAEQKEPAKRAVPQ